MLIPGGCIKQVKAPELNLQVNNWDCVYLWILQNFKGHLFCRTPARDYFLVFQMHLPNRYGEASLSN